MQEASKVIVVVFDGLRPDMVTAERMPNLAAFAQSSIWFREARSVFPSMTRVATASIATGAPPAVHGLMGNTFYFPEASPDYVFDTSRADDLALAESKLGGPLLTAPTFADVLARANRTLAVVHSGSTGSAYAINPRAAQNGHWTFSNLGEEHTRTPAAVREVVARFGPLPPRSLPRFEEVDYTARVFIEHVLADTNPDVALIWFNEPDTSYHYRFLGAPDTYAVLERVDAAFARIIAAINARADARDVAVIVASDHGQISSTGLIDMAEKLTEAGHPAKTAATRSLEGCAVALTGGNMGEIRVLDGDLERRDAIARWLMRQDFIGMVFTPGNDPVRGDLEGTFSLKLVGMDHDRAPHLMYVMRSSRDADIYGWPGNGLITGGVPVGGGMHGGLNAHELNTVLMLGGAAARHGGRITWAPAGIIDIAPTILDLLDIAAPQSMRGRSLARNDANLDQVAHETLVARAGAFSQQLVIARRGEHCFPVHGQRVS